jgi:hypothetical protein
MSDRATYIALRLPDAVLGNAIGNARSELADAVRALLAQCETDPGLLGYCHGQHRESVYRRTHYHERTDYCAGWEPIHGGGSHDASDLPGTGTKV